ncbi:MAG: hypothetical protein BM485_15830 [Desulfobulbaceae bacterium DB1]|nr:MAG: hypothetical protein BM485_15830 [Desulfobulbaceae bacterium DB1]
MKKIVVAVCLLGCAFVFSGCALKNGAGPRFVPLNKGICRDTVSGRMWQTEKGRYAKSLQEANDVIAELNRTSGYTDWRLPSVAELYDLNYLFDLHQNGECTLDREGSYWSVDKSGEGVVGAWEISDQCDPQRKYAPGTKGYVRAVRP